MLFKMHAQSCASQLPAALCINACSPFRLAQLLAATVQPAEVASMCKTFNNCAPLNARPNVAD